METSSPKIAGQVRLKDKIPDRSLVKVMHKTSNGKGTKRNKIQDPLCKVFRVKTKGN